VPLVILTGLLAAQLCKEGLGAEIATIGGNIGICGLFGLFYNGHTESTPPHRKLVVNRVIEPIAQKSRAIAKRTMLSWEWTA